jgi:hypothetical protein
MNARAELRSRALPWALALGVLADLLVRVDGRPGLNVALWALAGMGVLVVLLRRRTAPAGRGARRLVAAAPETQWLLGGALGFAGALVLRDAEALAVSSGFGAVVLLLLAAGRAAGAWAARAQVSHIAFAAARVGLLCAAGPLGWGRSTPGSAPDGAPWIRRARTVARGTAMALPPLLVLTALLMSADPLFAHMIESAFVVDLERVVEHLVFAAVTAWLTAGYLRAFLVGDDDVMDRLRVPRPALAAAEVSVALWMLNLLFVGFMAVQLRYLFGGAGLVEVTAGLSYADYARRGFFELVATAALVVPILLLADWAAAPATPRTRGVLRATMLVLVVLLVGVLASAAYRMRLYQVAYGLTEARLYVSVFIIWLMAVLGWLVLTVLRGRRERFAFGSIAAGLACMAALYAVNPHAVIARVNIERATAGAAYDGSYLRTLSADAVPTLLARLHQLPEAERCRVVGMLEERWSGERAGGWLAWNLSDWRARRRVIRLTGTVPCHAGPRAAGTYSATFTGDGGNLTLVSRGK